MFEINLRWFSCVWDKGVLLHVLSMFAEWNTVTDVLEDSAVLVDTQVCVQSVFVKNVLSFLYNNCLKYEHRFCITLH